jgi:uncharacterized membrane protein (DUF485 family)
VVDYNYIRYYRIEEDNWFNAVKNENMFGWLVSQSRSNVLLIYLLLVTLISYFRQSAYSKYIEFTNVGSYKISKLTK